MVDKNTDIDVDKIIEKLLEGKGSKIHKNFNLTEQQVKNLCAKARKIFMDQPMLLELEAPIKICGKFFCGVHVLCLL
jgi:serine/threonine-protein phosphatase PP1 catalytic subunit